MWTETDIGDRHGTTEAGIRGGETEAVEKDKRSSNGDRELKRLIEEVRELQDDKRKDEDKNPVEARVTRLEGRVRALEELLTQTTPAGNKKLGQLGRTIKTSSPFRR